MRTAHRAASGARYWAPVLAPLPPPVPAPRSSLAPPLLLRPWIGALDRALAGLLLPPGTSAADFREPAGEPALTTPDSVSWQVFKNPVALFVGGVAAVLLELAEPRVRAGVWQHTSFRERPLLRLQRTGHAAMVTVYGARSRAERLIAQVVQRHARVQGHADDGRPYTANDPALLGWVHATACFGFLEAYAACVRPLPDAARDRFYADSRTAGALYGAPAVPGSQAELHALFDAMTPQLGASPVLDEFLGLMAAVPVLPAPLRGLQRVLLRSAVALLPPALQQRLGLLPAWAPRPLEQALVRRAGAAADRLLLPGSPAVLACRRIGLADDFLYRAG
jgi:uncharacterized protein (DUF2236 family)